MAPIRNFKKKINSGAGQIASHTAFHPYRVGSHYRVDVVALENRLTGFWSGNRWEMRRNPTGIYPRGKDSYQYITFNCSNAALNTELKYVCFQKFESRAWSPRSNAFAQQIHRIIKFLNETAPDINSLLDNTLEKWEMVLRTYLLEEGLWLTRSVQKLTGSQQFVTSSRSSRCLEVFSVIYRFLEGVYDQRAEYERDVWDVKKMGTAVNLARSESTLNFTGLNPDWLRAAAKKYLRLYIANKSLTAAAGNLVALIRFGKFISEKCSGVKPENINRQLLLEYVSYLAETKLTQNIRRAYLQALIWFLDACEREQWLPITEKRLLYREDLPPRVKRHPRFIPEFVMGQLEELLPQMPNPLQRLTLIVKECGMRVSELCTLKTECLLRDADGDYFLFYHIGKTRKDHSIPLSENVAAAIIAQRDEVKASGVATEYLFPRTNGKPFKCKYFGQLLNEFAFKHNIADQSGKLWRFQAHQFRHTVGTRMINHNVPQIFVQKFLGHESMEMTSVYAQIHDQTLKNSFEKYISERGSLMDIAGITNTAAKPLQPTIDIYINSKSRKTEALAGREDDAACQNCKGQVSTPKRQ